MKSKPCSVEEFGHESVVATQLRDNFLRFVPCEDNWNLGRPFSAFNLIDERKFSIEHLLVKKQQCTEGLVLGRG